MTDINNDENNFDKTTKWYWEGNVQEKIAQYMREHEGFKIISVADTLSKGHGPDILGERNGIRREVVVKGFPSDKVTEGDKKGQPKQKKTQRRQTGHWIDRAIAQVSVAKSKEPELEIALGLPKFTVYIKRWNKLKWFRQTIRLYCYFVDENNYVTVLNPEEDIQVNGSS